MEDRELSQAVIAYLAKGRSPFPKSDAEAAKGAATESDPDDLLTRVTDIVAECMSVEIDWSSSTLVEAGRHAQREMAARHPELGADALEALYWAFTYNWR
ncbi:hypothetical protein [Microbacterium sp. JZ31]|uniref:hypothetical protein n=1 Tax=Microbacterium sp. JZ31 TaxID=1906274 RepID=UPI0019321C34|nr:hypothetical protein [Microbacterium sp. JZ31]